MKSCPGCRAEYADEKRFCPKCGARLVSALAVSPAATAKRESYEARLRERPMDPGLLAEYGSFLADSGFLDEALVQLHKAVEFDPRHSIAIEWLAKAYGALGDRAAALRHWQDLLAVSGLPAGKRAMALLESARLHLEHGEPEGAADMLRQATLLDPRNRSILEQRRSVLDGRGAGHASELEEVCRALIALDSQDAASWEALAKQYLRQGDRDRATAAFESLQQLDADHPLANLHLGITAYDEARNTGGRFEPVLAFLDRALAGAGQISEAEASVARLLRCDVLRRVGSAEVIASDALATVAGDLLPTERRALFADLAERSGKALLASGAAAEAVEWLGKAERAEGSPGRAALLTDAYAKQAAALLRGGRQTEALRVCEAGLTQTPDAPEILAVRQRILASRTRKAIVIAAAVTVAVAAGVLALVFSRGGLGVEVPAEAQVEVTSFRPPHHFRAVARAWGTFSTHVAPGSYLLHVTQAGHLAWDSMVVVRGGRTTAVRPGLLSGWAPWTFRSDPPAQLVLDGKDRGQTPIHIDRLPMGKHTVGLSAPFFAPWTGDVEVEPDRPRTLQATLVGFATGRWIPRDQSTWSRADVWDLKQSGNQVTGHIADHWDPTPENWHPVSAVVDASGVMKLREMWGTNVYCFDGRMGETTMTFVCTGGEGMGAQNAEGVSYSLIRLDETQTEAPKIVISQGEQARSPR